MCSIGEEEHPQEKSLDPFWPRLLVGLDYSLLFDWSVPTKQNSDPLWILPDNTNATWRQSEARAANICKQLSDKHIERYRAESNAERYSLLDWSSANCVNWLF